jgi:hypothetical protein
MRFAVIGMLTVTVAVMPLAGCTTHQAPSSAAHGSIPVSASSVGAPPPKSVAETACVQSFPGQRVIGWEATTVSGLSVYRIGPPSDPPPLAAALADVPAAQTATWCLVQISATSSSLWGVVSGRRPLRALISNGPGAGDYSGQMTRPPQPP